MTNIIDFFIRHKNTLLFVFLLFISLLLTFQAHSYQKSKFVSSTNEITGGIQAFRADVSAYFGLKEANNRLVDENKALRQRLLNLSFETEAIAFPDTTGFTAEYTVFKANVISNQYAQLDNYILIDRGKKDSIAEDQGVITSKGVIGIVEKASDNYARVISVLNTNLAINAQLKNSEHFGTLSWSGGDPNRMQLSDVPRLAEVAVGDTIITNGRSLIFPKGIPVGVVEQYQLDDDDNYYVLDVKLFNDMTSIGNVYIIKNNSREEIEKLNSPDEQ